MSFFRRDLPSAEEASRKLPVVIALLFARFRGQAALAPACAAFFQATLSFVLAMRRGLRHSPELRAIFGQPAGTPIQQFRKPLVAHVPTRTKQPTDRVQLARLQVLM